jgi:UPF0755 protein
MKWIAAIVVLVLLVAGVGAYTTYRRAYAPFRGYEGEQLVDIPAGSGTSTIGRRLVGAGVVRDELTFRVALRLSGNARRLQAGEYRFDRPLSAVDVIGKIARGEVDLRPITFPEGLTISEMSRIFEASGLGSAASFIEASKDVSPVSDLDPAARDLEGYLFPDTYALPRSADAQRVVKVMVERFREVMTADLVGAASERGWTVRELVTLASLVEKETARPEERPLVAAVYTNRLEVGMGLQCDPTVIYALQSAGRYDGNLRRDDLAFDSPYNTYRYPGLPPGPIAAPGKGALEAAARPADADFLYFVSRNDGSHEFARTLDEHNRNVRKFQVQYFRNRRLAGESGSR